jgi:hypothetical protein
MEKVILFYQNLLKLTYKEMKANPKNKVVKNLHKQTLEILDNLMQQQPLPFLD